MGEGSERTEKINVPINPNFLDTAREIAEEFVKSISVEIFGGDTGDE